MKTIAAHLNQNRWFDPQMLRNSFPKSSLNLRGLAKLMMTRFNQTETESLPMHATTVVTGNTYSENVAPSANARLGKTEYRRLVELGHWHYMRRRRRNRRCRYS